MTEINDKSLGSGNRRFLNHVAAARTQPRVSDNDIDEITVSLDGSTIRGWSYTNEDQRRAKMLQAREYVEGWCDGWEYAK